MKSLWVRKEDQGFTLVEVMIVMALIGILATIAVPRFMAFQAKARQSEAKVGLGGVFTAATIYCAANNSCVTATAQAINYVPAGSAVYTFNYASVSGAGSPASLLNSGTSDVFCPGTAWTATVPATATMGFTAGARGNVDTDPTCDEWVINDIRSLSNPLNDVLN